MSTGNRFITLEGIEGVGKSTHVEAVVDALRGRGESAVRTREPGGSPVADRIRSLLLDPDGEAPLAETELLLLFAARSEHLARVIQPALDGGQYVVCDRFTDATYAYQGGGRGLSSERIAALEAWVQGELRPDLTILLDAPVQVALERARGRGATDRFERETTAFFERARDVYLERARAEPGRFRVIDATGPVERVRDQVVAAALEAT
ncbi:MAG: dTMP kinase [Halofilum sp. (in: g-proteobacteria)]|nr:dTMP kinase [Halofilum sp. (in: g-proteobacteria)]